MKKMSTDVEELKKIIQSKDAWLKDLTPEEILSLMPLEFPDGSKEYEDILKDLGTCQDYGQWKRDLAKRLKEKGSQIEGGLSKEQAMQEALEMFKEKFLRHGKSQASKLINKRGEIAQSIHVLTGNGGYKFKPYFGEGRKLTLDEKIEKYKKQLSESTVQLLKEHFTPENLKKVLQGRKEGSIKTVRPKDDGLNYYIWRMTRFHCGKDVTMPMMATMELKIYLEDHIPKEEVKTAQNLADLLLDKVHTEIFKGKANIGAYRWAKALGWLI